MNTKRLFIGDIYSNKGIGKDNKYEYELIEKDALLIKFKNMYIKANIIKDELDLITFYTLLRYYPLKYIVPLSDYVMKTDNNKAMVMFVDKDSLKRYNDKDIKISFDKFLSLSYIYTLDKETVKTKKK